MKARNHALCLRKRKSARIVASGGSKYSRQIPEQHGSLFIHQLDDLIPSLE